MTDDLKNTLPEYLYNKVKDVFKEMKLSESQRKKASEKIAEFFQKSKYEAGEAIGIVAAQSISEPATQMTMRTYQTAGAVQIQVTLGLPRLIEIFDARSSPSTPSMLILLKSAWNTQEKAYDISKKIIEVKLSDVISSSVLDLVEQRVDFKLDEKLLKENGLKADDVLNVAKESLSTANVTGGATRISIKLKREFKIKDLQKLKAKALKLHISGLKGVSNAVVNQNKDGKWEINTIGSNLAKILDVEGVDSSQITSNNIHEVSRVLGIEAARASIVSEVMNTLENQGLDVDIRHIMLVSDIMTVDGKIRAIGRYGIAGAKGSVLARANFEETIKHLTRAALENEIDTLDSIVENVMINQVVPAGTGMFDLTFKFPGRGKGKDPPP